MSLNPELSVKCLAANLLQRDNNTNPELIHIYTTDIRLNFLIFQKTPIIGKLAKFKICILLHVEQL